ncbi:ras protein let-60-like [Ruditapes philippinarum]|uniref:ras protein let-60-like n=1 Tax=Ruditapes philippinarum TaxID=129788 RepID=UPI00295AA55D|nr:ras protein let-60-like [Ruditapes philippinarum]
MYFESIEFKYPTSTHELSSRLTMRMRSVTGIQGNKIRVLVIGDTGVGKSMMINQFSKKRFIEDFEDNNPSEEGAIVVELMEIDVNLVAALKRLAIKTAQAYILMHSYDNPQSFEYIRKVKQEIEEMKGVGMPVVVVGNKIDISRRINQHRSQHSEVINWGLPHTDISLRTGMNIGGVYRHLFSHRTLQRLVDVVAVINASSVSASIRRMSLPAFEAFRVPEVNVTEAQSEILTENEKQSSDTFPLQKQRASTWAKFKQVFSGAKVRK